MDLYNSYSLVFWEKINHKWVLKAIDKDRLQTVISLKIRTIFSMVRLWPSVVDLYQLEACFTQIHTGVSMFTSVTHNQNPKGSKGDRWFIGESISAYSNALTKKQNKQPCVSTCSNKDSLGVQTVARAHGKWPPPHGGHEADSSSTATSTWRINRVLT